jgi:hypothetical protein
MMMASSLWRDSTSIIDLLLLRESTLSGWQFRSFASAGIARYFGAECFIAPVVAVPTNGLELSVLEDWSEVGGKSGSAD